MDAGARTRRWTREWGAIAAGTLLIMLTALALLASMDPILMMQPAEPTPVWAGALLLGAPVVLPFVLAAVSGRSAWARGGAAGLGAGVLGAAILGVPLLLLVDDLTVPVTVFLACAGAVALHHEHRRELVARAAAVAVLVVASAGIAVVTISPMALLALPAIGVADLLAAQVRG